jgi:hypothetical protein
VFAVPLCLELGMVGIFFELSWFPDIYLQSFFPEVRYESVQYFN